MYASLQERYDQELADYQREEARYRSSLETNPQDSSLHQRFEDLQVMRADLDRLFGQVSALRESLSEERDEALGRASIY